MTRENAKEMLPVIQAYADGKEIQFRAKGDTEWTDNTDPGFGHKYEYRVKPEKKWRAWTGGDIPLNAVFRWKKLSFTDTFSHCC